jgi:S1-C subfamily serine protease
MQPRVIKSRKAAEAHNPHEPGLVLVPGKWVPAVVSFMSVLQKHRNTGLIVTNVGPNSAAAHAGIARGDVLLRCDGAPLDRVFKLRRMIGAPAREGADSERRMVIEAVRGKNELRFEVPASRLGMTVSSLLRSRIPTQH